VLTDEPAVAGTGTTRDDEGVCGFLGLLINLLWVVLLSFLRMVAESGITDFELKIALVFLGDLT